METHVDDLIKEIRSTNSPYVLKSTKITTGPRKGEIFLEIVSKTGFRFLDLHSELRNRIYYLLLVKPDPICLAIFRRRIGAKVVTGTGFDNQRLHPGKVWDSKRHKWAGDPPNELSLLLVNKQIHGEATPIVYGRNRFIQGSSTALVYFVPVVGASINFLTVVDFGEACTRDNMRRLFTSLYAATGLRRLTLSEPMVSDSHSGRYSRLSSLDCAGALAKDLRALLLCLQVSYKTQGRTWKALDLVRIRPAFTKMQIPLQLKEDAKNMQITVRRLTNVYLKEE